MATDYGLKVVNTFNDISIDSNWVNYSRWYEGSIACAAGSWDPGAGGSPTYPKTTIVFPEVLTSIEPPILFLRHDAFTRKGHMLAGCNPVGVPGAWTGIQLAFGGSGTKQMYFRIYAILPKSAAFGMFVQLDDGTIAFDSGRLPLIVERVVVATDWDLTYNGAAGSGFREQDWTITRPTQEYVCVSSIIYYDGITGRTTGRVFVQFGGALEATGNPNTVRLFGLFDSGSTSVNPGTGSRFAILPMLCDNSV